MDTFVQAGGWLMIPLVLSSLVAIAVILALFMTLKKDKVIPDGLADKAQKLAKSGKMTQGHIDQIKEGSLLGGVLATAIAPLLGLLGTVVGMIVVFNEMLKQGGVGNPADLAGGISQALVTTAFGISIAVPALIFHRYFRGKINDYAIEMEQQAIRLLEIVNVPNRRATDIANGKVPQRKRPAQAVNTGRVA
ncbi:Biopolymer transport protein ExbB [Nymphon striatum]|nr:Biopolymer transport protein ExbB [Nymphon striatum]